MNTKLPLLLSFNHLKEHYGISRSSSNRWVITSGFPPPIKLGLNSVRFRREEVDEWIANRPTAEQDPDTIAVRNRRTVA